MSEEYRTTDIVLAASLVVHGQKMVKIEVNGSRGTFVFDSVSQDFLDDYEYSKCKVEPVSFNNAIKRLTTSVRRMTQSK